MANTVQNQYMISRSSFAALFLLSIAVHAYEPVKYDEIGCLACAHAVTLAFEKGWPLEQKCRAPGPVDAARDLGHPRFRCQLNHTRTHINRDTAQLVIGLACKNFPKEYRISYLPKKKRQFSFVRTAAPDSNSKFDSEQMLKSCVHYFATNTNVDTVYANLKKMDRTVDNVFWDRSEFLAKTRQASCKDACSGDQEKVFLEHLDRHHRGGSFPHDEL